MGCVLSELLVPTTLLKFGSLAILNTVRRWDTGNCSCSGPKPFQLAFAMDTVLVFDFAGSPSLCFYFVNCANSRVLLLHIH
jgi:hypothetical protein